MRSSTSPNFLPFVFAFTIPPCSLPSPPVCLASLHEMLFVFSLHLFLSNLQHFVWLAPSDVSLNSVLPLKVNSCAWAVRHTSVWMRPSPGSGGDPMKLPGVSSCHVVFPACPTPDPFPEGGNHEITPYKQMWWDAVPPAPWMLKRERLSCHRCTPFSSTRLTRQ